MRRCLPILLLAACHASGGENLGLGAQRAPSINVRRLADPEELLRALALPGRELDRSLGAHRLVASSTLTVTPPGRPAEKLEQQVRLDSDGAGALHLVKESSAGGGLEAVLAGGQLYVRPRYGRFVEHRPEGDEVERLRALAEGAGAGTLGVLARWLEVREAGHAPATPGGRDAVRLQLAARAAPLEAAPTDQPAHAWRERMQVSALTGEVALDAASGAPLSLTLQAAYTFTREQTQEPIAVAVELRQNVAPAEPVVAPADAAPAPRRVRPLLDRQELLDGLVAP
jgi:hypothetical protein